MAGDVSIALMPVHQHVVALQTLGQPSACIFPALACILCYACIQGVNSHVLQIHRWPVLLACLMFLMLACREHRFVLRKDLDGMVAGTMTYDPQVV